MDEGLTPERFAGLLRAIYLAEDERLRADYQRSLPFQDALFDRWERARRLGFASDASIYNSAAVFGDVSVAKRPGSARTRCSTVAAVGSRSGHIVLFRAAFTSTPMKRCSGHFLVGNASTRVRLSASGTASISAAKA